MAMKKRFYTMNSQMMAYDEGGETKDFLTDHLGSITAEINQSQTRTYDTRYSAYGRNNWSTGTVCGFGWVGSYGYRETGLFHMSHYVRARHYSYLTGNWSTVDPLWPDESAYGYVLGRALRAIDPSGLAMEICIRPVIPGKDIPGYDHWFFNSSTCGAFGFGPDGPIVGWGDNALIEKVRCFKIPMTPEQEKCLCALKGKKEWPSIPGAPKPRCWNPGRPPGSIPGPFGLPKVFPDPDPNDAGTKVGKCPYGKPPGGFAGLPDYGEYHAKFYNCQDYVQVALARCLGSTLAWPEQGPTYGKGYPPIKGVPTKI